MESLGYIKDRDSKHFKALLKNSKVARAFYMSQIHPDSDRGLSPTTYNDLKSLNWVESCCNIVISGKTGSGKTTLAIALAVLAMQNNYAALFISACELIANLKVKEGTSLVNYARKLKRYKVIVVDDFGLEIMDSVVANRLLFVLSTREMDGSIILTSQLKADKVPLTIEKGPARDAIADRLFRLGVDFKIELSGTSYRQSGNAIKGERVNG